MTGWYASQVRDTDKLESAVDKGLTKKGNKVNSSFKLQFQSPRYPEAYPPGADCLWTMRVPEGFQVAVHIVFFHVGIVFCNKLSSFSARAAQRLHLRPCHFYRRWGRRARHRHFVWTFVRHSSSDEEQQYYGYTVGSGERDSQTVQIQVFFRQLCSKDGLRVALRARTGRMRQGRSRLRADMSEHDRRIQL